MRKIILFIIVLSLLLLNFSFGITDINNLVSVVSGSVGTKSEVVSNSQTQSIQIFDVNDPVIQSNSKNSWICDGEFCCTNAVPATTNYCFISKVLPGPYSSLESINYVTMGSPSTTIVTPITLSCTSQRCKEVDDVWTILCNDGLKHPNCDKIYDPTNGWIVPPSVIPIPIPPVEPVPPEPSVPTQGTPESVEQDQRLLEIYNKYKSYIDTAAKENSIDVSLIVALIEKESLGISDAVSLCGAVGLMQLIPKTARDMGLNVKNYDFVDKSKTDCTAEGFSQISDCYRKKGNKINDYSGSNCKPGEDQRFDAEKSISAGSKYVKSMISNSNNDLKLGLKKYHGSKEDLLNEKYADDVISIKKRFEELQKNSGGSWWDKVSGLWTDSKESFIDNLDSIFKSSKDELNKQVIEFKKEMKQKIKNYALEKIPSLKERPSNLLLPDQKDRLKWIYVNYYDIISTIASDEVSESLIVAMIEQGSKGLTNSVSQCGRVGYMQVLVVDARNVGLSIPQYGVSTEEIKKCINTNKGYISNCKRKSNWGYTSESDMIDFENCDPQKDDRFVPEKNIEAGVKIFKSKLQEIKSKNPSLSNTNLYKEALNSYNPEDGYPGGNYADNVIELQPKAQEIIDNLYSELVKEWLWDKAKNPSNWFN